MTKIPTQSGKEPSRFVDNGLTCSRRLLWCCVPRPAKTYPEINEDGETSGTPQQLDKLPNDENARVDQNKNTAPRLGDTGPVHTGHHAQRPPAIPTDWRDPPIIRTTIEPDTSAPSSLAPPKPLPPIIPRPKKAEVNPPNNLLQAPAADGIGLPSNQTPSKDSRSFRGSWSKLTSSFREAFSRSRDNIRTEPLRLFVGTWNMNAHVPTGDISTFLGDARNRATPPFSGCHIVVIGTQECEERLESAGIRQPKEKQKWVTLLKVLVGNSYVLIGTRTLVGLHLAVFVLKRCRQHVSGIKSAYVKVYLNGAKGAVAISFGFLGRSFCFINAHLRAHEGSMEQRNADWKKINETLNLGGHGRKAGGILDQFDYVFWMGDLNYRINMGSNKVALAKSLLAKENPEIDIFLANDELRKAYEANVVFNGYSEGRITFRPTFKYSIANAASPTSPTSPTSPSSPIPSAPHDPYSNRRIPSYTDRILYATRLSVPVKSKRINSNNDVKDQTTDVRRLGECLNQRIEVEKYTDCPAVVESDHKPVYGIYRLAEEVPIE